MFALCIVRISHPKHQPARRSHSPSGSQPLFAHVALVRAQGLYDARATRWLKSTWSCLVLGLIWVSLSTGTGCSWWSARKEWFFKGFDTWKMSQFWGYEPPQVPAAIHQGARVLNVWVTLRAVLSWMALTRTKYLTERKGSKRKSAESKTILPSPARPLPKVFLHCTAWHSHGRDFRRIAEKGFQPRLEIGPHRRCFQAELLADPPHPRSWCTRNRGWDAGTGTTCPVGVCCHGGCYCFFTQCDGCHRFSPFSLGL